jgi:hypothetical protein
LEFSSVARLAIIFAVKVLLAAGGRKARKAAKAAA